MVGEANYGWMDSSVCEANTNGAANPYVQHEHGRNVAHTAVQLTNLHGRQVCGRLAGSSVRWKVHLRW
jgi:hypothetical protein